MIRPVMAGFVSLSLLVATTSPQDSQKTQKKDSQQPDQTDRATKLGQQGVAEQNVKADQQKKEQNQRVELPESLTQLELTEQQKKELLVIYRDSDLKSQQVWDRVQDLHRQAISMEAAVIAAARLEGHDHSAHGKQDAQPANADQQPRAKADGAKKEAAAGAIPAEDLKGITPDSSPEDDAQTRKDENTRGENGADVTSDERSNEPFALESSHTGSDNAAGWQGLDGDLNIVAIRVAIAQPDGRIREHLLTQPGQNEDSGSNEAFHTCQGQLTQVWKDIHEGHEQLVEIEASTIVQVEAQLTEAQLQKLDTTQRQASNTKKSQNDEPRR